MAGAAEVGMSGQFVTVPTLFKSRFRKTEANALQRWCATGGGEWAFHQDAAVLARQDAVMRFLVDMDRKLDAILTLLQRESIEADFPCAGYVLELSGSGLVLETRESLAPGQHLELLLMFGTYPQRLVSVMGEVKSENRDKTGTETGSSIYNISYTCMNAEDREIIIAFVFQEDRKRIRRRKEEA